ncbi:MAG: Gfo/Idh/MocA family oxidoreductase [Proteobacteria bacterium]|nr:Gfo/Idh/MocA family oxidoreductase [Pseudomonadota bacterium]MBU4384654.1 Gfo/Idh/MocA family oxidoreductase [Pseudomonadota bacterium]MCG2766198.1 Gfo/Idh/MocA family oxidoreductase [Desulfarculaceae bacterium]
MSEKLKFGFVGCGAIANKHAEALSMVPDAELAAVYDQNTSVAKAFSQKKGVPYYDDVRKMIAAEGIQVLSLLTPSGVHGSLLLELADAGVHFVVEKPMALRLEEADEMIRACSLHGVQLFVVQQNRFNPPIQALRRALDQGRFGKLVMGTVRVRWSRNQEYYDSKKWRGTWAMDGGVITNQASHHIDMLEWCMGSVESVMAMTSTRLVDIETEDTGLAILRFTNGALGVIEATTATRPKDLEGSISILGEHGAVEVGGFYMNELKTWQFEDETEEDAEVFEKHGSTPKVFAWNHAEYLKDVVRAIRLGGRGLVEGMDGRRSLELIMAIYESAETGSEVKLRFRPKVARLGLPNHK